MTKLSVRWIAVVLCLSVLTQSGCAIVAPYKESLLLESDPPGATIFVDAVEVGTTPKSVKVRKSGSTPVSSNNPPKIEFKLPGYRDTQFRPSAQKLSAFGWFDVLYLGILVSAFSPGAWAFSNDRFAMTLEPTGTRSEIFAKPGDHGPRYEETPADQRLYRVGYSKRIAITIGIDDYSQWPPLEGGRQDATRVASKLRELGFDEVIEVYDQDATRTRLLRLLGTELVNKADEEALVLIFFAGHGQTETLANGERRGYIVPADATTEDAFSTAISMEKIRDLSERIPAKHLYYAMDSCYSGLGLTRGISVKPSSHDFLKAATSRRSVQMMTAGGQGEKAIEVGGRGIFTTYLLEAMSGAADANADGLVSASEIGSFVRPRVAGASQGRQNPQFGTLDGGGEIVFEINP